MMTTRASSLVFRVYTLRCGNCPHVASTMDAERTKAAMLEHLIVCGTATS